jgi:Ca2+:H+ antiporter
MGIGWAADTAARPELPIGYLVIEAGPALIGTLTFSSGRATVLQGAQHLAVFASFVFLSLVP